MQYLVTFLEGLVSFLSPCMLPLLPVYVSYFAAGSAEDSGKPAPKSLLFLRALAFVLGFTVLVDAEGNLMGGRNAAVTDVMLIEAIEELLGKQQ